VQHILSSSTITGQNVVNAAGENIGNVKEIMVDTKHGRISYAVLSFGGFLGLGDKLFAIPFDAMALDEPNNRFVVDIPKETLQNAEGFDKNDWPDFGNPEFNTRTYRHYGVNPYWN